MMDMELLRTELKLGCSLLLDPLKQWIAHPEKKKKKLLCLVL